MKQSKYKYITHSENSNDAEQSVRQHSESVTELMGSFTSADDFAEIYSYCGLLHGIGEYSKGLQNYIKSREEKEPHAKWGAYIALVNELVNIASPVIGHHAGFPNRDTMVETLGLYVKGESRWKNIQQAMEGGDFIISIYDNSSFNKIKSVFQKELFV